MICWHAVAAARVVLVARAAASDAQAASSARAAQAGAAEAMAVSTAEAAAAAAVAERDEAVTKAAAAAAAAEAQAADAAMKTIAAAMQEVQQASVGGRGGGDGDGDDASLLLRRRHLDDAGRRLGLWNPMATTASPLALPTGSVDVHDYVESLPTLPSRRDKDAAMRAFNKMEAAATQFATRVYLELPSDKKVLVMQAVQDPEKGVPLLRYLLKETKLVTSLRRQMAFSRAEVEDCVDFASDASSPRFDAVATALLSRAPSTLTHEEKEAMKRVWAATLPLARSTCMLVAWLDARGR